MNTISTNNLTAYSLAIVSAVLITGACVFFISFLSQFIQYATDLLSLASSETHHYLQTMPH